jgi:hypothetical protein
VRRDLRGRVVVAGVVDDDDFEIGRLGDRRQALTQQRPDIPGDDDDGEIADRFGLHGFDCSAGIHRFDSAVSL